jgi:reductive dehalogenase
MHLTEILNLVVALLVAIVFGYAAIVSVFEKERRAAIMILFFGVLLMVPPLILFWFSNYFVEVVLYILPGIYIVVPALFFFPFQIKKSGTDADPVPGYDERKIMFSRNELEPGTVQFEKYYRDYPEHLEPDNHFRSKPGLLNEKAVFADAFLFNAAKASFETVKTFHQIVDGPVNPEKENIESAQLTGFLKYWAKKLGAKDVGITLLKDYHKYETIGRGDDYGKPVQLDHKYAIALTVEMDKDLIDTAPKAPVTMETSHIYLESGEVAVQLAVFLRKLGFESRAHIDGNYRVICPLVAKDAGLGNIGRMGLLMTPKEGPRVRIAVVTTDAPLEPDTREPDHSMKAFCRVCKKCAENCPSRAIPFANEEVIDGVKRWQINQEKCFTYWCQVGTDCGKCIAVCPYSHPDNLFHNIVRFGIRHNPFFRQIAAKLDDVFYGKKVKSKKWSY